MGRIDFISLLLLYLLIKHSSIVGGINDGKTLGDAHSSPHRQEAAVQTSMTAPKGTSGESGCQPQCSGVLQLYEHV